MIENKRQTKGQEIAARKTAYHGIRKHRKNFYRVQSQTSSKIYDVMRTKRNTWTCTCLDHTYRHVVCKHIYAVNALITKLGNARNKRANLPPVPTIMGYSAHDEPTILKKNDLACRYCNSTNLKKDGIRKNKYGPIQKYRCKDCAQYFTINPGFEGMRHNPKIITFSMHMYFSGASLRKVSQTLTLLGISVTHQTVYNWIKKYVSFMQKHLDKLVPQVSDVWRADELFLKIKGNMSYLYSIMDDETRFWIARQVSDKKFTENVRPLFAEAKKIAEKRPDILITDGARNFHEAFYQEYWKNTAPRPLHIRHISIKGDHNNNKMERLNGEFREREKILRGLKKKNTVIIPGYQLFHNFIRPHMGLNGKTPAEKCGIGVEGENKWITLIQNASKKQSKLSDYA